MPCFGKFPRVKNFVNEKDGGGSIKNFCRKHFVSVPKNLVEEPSRVSRNPSLFQKVSGTE